MSLWQQIYDFITVQDVATKAGFFYTIAYIGAVLVYVINNPRRKKGLITGVKLFMLSVLLLCFHFLTANVAVYLFIPSIVLIFVIITVMIKTTCDMNLRNTLYYAVRAYTLGEFTASLMWQLFYYGIITNDMKRIWYVLVPFAAASYIVVIVPAFLLERHINRDKEHLHVERQEVLVSVVMCIVIYVISNLSYVDISTPFSSNLTIDIFIIRTFVDLAGVSILTAYHIQLKATHSRIEMSQMEALYKTQYANYQISKESVELINRKYHDMKHQIALLRSGISSDEKLQCLDEIERDIKQYEAQNKTGNQVLDIILTTKSLQCQKLNIQMTCITDGSLLDFMEPMDISSLFGNALDNAITEVEKIANPEKKLIHVTVSKDRSFLRIRFENCYEGKITLKNGLPVTTKGDRRYHGFGIKSIKSIAEKYNGSLTINTEKGWFEIRILIPL